MPSWPESNISPVGGQKVRRDRKSGRLSTSARTNERGCQLNAPLRHGDNNNRGGFRLEKGKVLLPVMDLGEANGSASGSLSPVVMMQTAHDRSWRNQSLSHIGITPAVGRLEILRQTQSRTYSPRFCMPAEEISNRRTKTSLLVSTAQNRFRFES